eukprot:gene6936-biopygen7460
MDTPQRPGLCDWTGPRMPHCNWFRRGVSWCVTLGNCLWADMSHCLADRTQTLAHEPTSGSYEPILAHMSHALAHMSQCRACILAAIFWNVPQPKELRSGPFRLAFRAALGPASLGEYWTAPPNLAAVLSLLAQRLKESRENLPGPMFLWTGGVWTGPKKTRHIPVLAIPPPNLGDCHAYRVQHEIRFSHEAMVRTQCWCCLRGIRLLTRRRAVIQIDMKRRTMASHRTLA